MTLPRALPLVAAFVLLLAPAARADETIIRPGGPQFGFREGDDFVWVFLGGVEVQQGDMTLRGETLVAILQPDGTGDESSGNGFFSTNRVREVYLEGPVDIIEGDERVVGAGAVHLDNTTGMLNVWDGELRATLPRGPIVLRFQTMRALANGDRELDQVSYTTCDYDHAHWAIHTSSATLSNTPEGRILQTGGNTMRVADMPVLWWPGLDINIDEDQLPISGIEFGSESRFGTLLGVRTQADAATVLDPVADLFNIDSNLRGSWELYTALYTKRGLFVEPTLRYQTDHSQGKIFGSFINDNADADHLDMPITDSTRGRFDIEHRTYLTNEGPERYEVLDIEASYLSDRNYLNEYYEDEFKEGKEQETYAYWRSIDGNEATTALVRQRLNDFDTQVNYLPEVQHRVTGEPLPMLGGAFLTAKTFFSEAKLRPDDALTAMPTVDNTRAGSTVHLDWPLNVGGDRVRITAGADVTGFTDTISAGKEIRRTFFGMAEWSRSYVGVDSEARNETWNIDGVRHILEPKLSYASYFGQNLEPKDLMPIDDIETLGERNEFRAGLRHRMQTHQDGQVKTILDTEVILPIFPHERRDNMDHTAGDVMINSRWRPGANVPGLKDADVRWRSLYDTNDGSYNQSYFSFISTIDEDTRFYIGDNKARGVFHFVTVGVQWILVPGWQVAVFVQQDKRMNENAEAGLALRQLAHCWFIDYVLEQERGRSTVDGSNEDEVRISLRFTPVIFQDPDEDLLSEIGSRIR